VRRWPVIETAVSRQRRPIPGAWRAPSGRWPTGCSQKAAIGTATVRKLSPGNVGRSSAGPYVQPGHGRGIGRFPWTGRDALLGFTREGCQGPVLPGGARTKKKDDEMAFRAGNELKRRGPGKAFASPKQFSPGRGAQAPLGRVRSPAWEEYFIDPVRPGLIIPAPPRGDRAPSRTRPRFAAAALRNIEVVAATRMAPGLSHSSSAARRKPQQAHLDQPRVGAQNGRGHSRRCD